MAIDDETPPAQPTAEDVARAWFKSAQGAVPTPVWVNHYYVQPWGTGGATVVFGGAYSLLADNGTAGVHARVSSCQWLPRDLVVGLLATLKIKLQISDEEIAAFYVVPPSQAKTE